MTNNEKFYETFGVKLEPGVSLCDICECSNRKCADCILYGHADDFNQYIDPKKYKSFKNPKQLLLDALSKEHEVVIGLAYSYAKNLDKYGVDITALWDNMVKNEQALGIAYAKGYYDALMQANNDKNRGGNKGKWIKVTNGRGGHECNVCHKYAPSFQNGDECLSRFCPNCGKEMEDVE